MAQSARPFVAFGAVLAVLAACAEQEDTSALARGASASGGTSAGAGTLDRDRLISSRTSLQDLLRALEMPHRRIAAHVGAHRVRCSSSLRTKVPGQPEAKIDQQLDLRMDDRRNFTAIKTTHPQYGSEVVWIDGWIYSRQLASKFIRRKPRKGEPEAIADRMYGFLPAYIELLGRFIRVDHAGGGQGKQRFSLRLSTSTGPASAPERVASRKWRRTIAVKDLTGRVVLDARSGVPLEAEIKARWTFHPPTAGATSATGIPKDIDPRTVASTTLSFTQRIEAIGKGPPLAAPPPLMVSTGIRRQRLEIERQLLTGERAMPRQGRAKATVLDSGKSGASRSGASP